MRSSRSYVRESCGAPWNLSWQRHTLPQLMKNHLLRKRSIEVLEVYDLKPCVNQCVVSRQTRLLVCTTFCLTARGIAPFVCLLFVGRAIYVVLNRLYLEVLAVLTSLA